MTSRDGHIRVLPLHVANKIAAGEVVERPASVAKELVENSIDAGARNIRIAITQGGRKLVSVQDDGCGMSRDDALLSLERQATSKILDVGDIEEIDTLGFRGEAIPSIASVSRFSLTTRRRDSDEGTCIQVNAGQLADVTTAGCPPGTLVEVRDLFCNVPARRKFLRAYVTEENHVKQIFTVHALAHPSIGFSLTIDGREIYRLAPAAALYDRVLELFGDDTMANLLPIGSTAESPDRQGAVSVSGFIEKPNLSQPTRSDQYIFVNGRPATSPSIAYAMREAYPRRQGDARPAAILFINLPPNQVDVNVHPTKREVRFRDNSAVKRAVMDAIESALSGRGNAPVSANREILCASPRIEPTEAAQSQPRAPESDSRQAPPAPAPAAPASAAVPTVGAGTMTHRDATPLPAPTPVQVEFAVDPESTASRPWQWFRYLAQTASGYILVETDSGLVTVNPQAARERIAYERLADKAQGRAGEESQALLIPDVVKLPPVDAARIRAALADLARMGFSVEEFGLDTFKVDAVPLLIGDASPTSIFATIARDLADSAGARRGGERWREEMIAKSIARAYAGMKFAADEAGATRIVEELCSCRMPYVSPRGKPIMIFTSTRELNRKFARE